MSLQARHIQNYSEATSLEPHWGYVARALPCTSDAGSCAYLDVVYHSHDLGMLYIGIFWASIVGILFIWMMLRSFRLQKRRADQSSTLQKGLVAIRSTLRHYLLPDACRAIFGRTTRLQVLILSIILGYLLIFSFVGIHYAHWITPVKKNPGLHNTRSSLGPFADRLGILAFGLTPLSILLSSRESILSLITGVPYQHFNFLHRWLGYVILVQGLLHTIGWTIVEARLYQPQPQTALEWISEPYMIFGCVAIILLFLLLVFSLPIVIRTTGYEFFRKAHYILAMLYIGACWGHWKQLNCFLIPSFVIWLLDRGVRMMRAFLLHYNVLPDGSMGFRPSQAEITLFTDSINGSVVRLDFDQPQQQPWKIGQHFYLCFTEGSIWQSHPFTPLSMPQRDARGIVRHSYIFRVKSGETSKIAALAAEKIRTSSQLPSTGVILTGPYGRSIIDDLDEDSNVLCLAAGNGITYCLPVLLHIARFWPQSKCSVSLIWIVRHRNDVQWIQAELDELEQSSVVKVTILSTRDEEHELEEIGVKASDQGVEEGQQEEAVNSILVKEAANRRPDVDALVKHFLQNTTSSRTTVFASGPGSFLSDLKASVASVNSGKKVWEKKKQADVKLVDDDRLEW
jgi:predicted ferric reductase